MRSMVEGAPFPTCVHDSENYPFQVIEHFLRGDTHGEETQLRKMSIPRRVPCWTIAPIMSLPANLDRQACGQTCEVE